MSDTVNTTSLQENEASEAEVIDKLAYTKKRYLRPKEIAAFVLVNFGQKNLSQFVGGEKQFFLVQYAGLDPKHFANIYYNGNVYLTHIYVHSISHKYLYFAQYIFYYLLNFQYNKYRIFFLFS